MQGFIYNSPRAKGRPVDLTAEGRNIEMNGSGLQLRLTFANHTEQVAFAAAVLGACPALMLAADDNIQKLIRLIHREENNANSAAEIAAKS